jgi:hypothetical protein
MTRHHWHVNTNGECKSWCDVTTLQSDAMALARAYRRAIRPRFPARYTITKHKDQTCRLYQEYRDHQASVPPVTEA